MNTLFSGSICLTELIEQAKKGHSAFSRAANQKVYVNINIWQNEEVDKFGNSISLQLQSKKENIEKEGKIYIGNAKKFERQDPKPLDPNNVSDITEPLDDLPF